MPSTDQPETDDVSWADSARWHPDFDGEPPADAPPRAGWSAHLVVQHHLTDGVLFHQAVLYSDTGLPDSDTAIRQVAHRLLGIPE